MCESSLEVLMSHDKPSMRLETEMDIWRIGSWPACPLVTALYNVCVVVKALKMTNEIIQRLSSRFKNTVQHKAKSDTINSNSTTYKQLRYQHPRTSTRKATIHYLTRDNSTLLTPLISYWIINQSRRSALCMSMCTYAQFS